MRGGAGDGVRVAGGDGAGAVVAVPSAGQSRRRVPVVSVVGFLDRVAWIVEAEGRERARNVLARALDERVDLGLEWVPARRWPWRYRVALRLAGFPAELFGLTPESRAVLDAYIATLPARNDR